jgi:selenocysteine lyase/cysteine desulfurase
VQVHDGAPNWRDVTFTVDGVAPLAVQSALHGAGINTNVSLETLVRASPHYYNTEGEIAGLVSQVERLVQR